jgi:hypothetical protein
LKLRRSKQEVNLRSRKSAPAGSGEKMDNLKKHLHLVVFGLGIVIGVALLFIGMGVVSGAEESLDVQTRQLTTVGPIYSEADLNAMRTARAGFSESYEVALNRVRGATGRALMNDIDPAMSQSHFQSNFAPSTLRSLQERFAAMERPMDLPGQFQEGWRYPQPAAEWSWETRSSTMQQAQQAQLVPFQIELRLLDELCTVAELLVQSGRYSGGIRLLDFTADGSFVSERERDASPWERLPFRFTVYCHPDLGAALVSELTRPTAITGGQTATNRQRHGIPVDLIAAQWHWTDRPNTARIDIRPENRQAYNIPAAAPNQGPEAQAHIQRIRGQLGSEVSVVQPARLVVRAAAKRFNNEWRALPVEDGQ